MATIQKRTITYDQLVINENDNVADVNDVLNVLTVLNESEKRLNFFDKPEATKFLVAAGLISEREPHMFAVENKEGCKALSDQLNNSITKLIEEYGKGLENPDVMFNSANAKVEEQK